MTDVWTKLCGCTNWRDVSLAIDAGADAFGMIFAPSTRRIAWPDAEEIGKLVPSSITPVAVFVNPTEEQVARVRAMFPQALLQFSGDESPEFVAPYGDRAIKTVHVDGPWPQVEQRAALFRDAVLLFDSRHANAYGGTGRTFEWSDAAPVAAARRVIVAGGLTSENVAECLESTHPFGVDVRSGIETDGRKDPQKMRAFVRAVRAWQ